MLRVYEIGLVLRGDKVAEFRKKIKSHVSAAKEWLGKAEQSLEERNDVKGNLNLMLAQAELTRAQEARKSGKHNYRTLLIHSMLIAGIVGLAFVVGFGGASILGTSPAVKPVLPQPAPSIDGHETAQLTDADLAIESKSVLQDTLAEKDSAVFIEPAKQHEEVAVTKGEKAIMPKNAEFAVTSVEMQQLVRAAGKSLRGQE